MTWLRTVLSEFIGLFVEDGRFAAAILAWLAACWLLLPRFGLSRALPPVILFAGLAVILVENTARRARQGA